MALLLLASLKAAGGAALLPLPYYLALVAAVAMVLKLSKPRLLARRAHQRAESCCACCRSHGRDGRGATACAIPHNTQGVGRWWGQEFFVPQAS